MQFCSTHEEMMGSGFRKEVSKQLCSASASHQACFLQAKILLKCCDRSGQNQNWTANYGQHVLRKDDFDGLGMFSAWTTSALPQEALYWQVPRTRIGPGRPRANWRTL